MATSARAQKEAYLRRKNLGPKTPRSEEAPIAVAPKSPRDPDEKTWQEKRKDNLLSRARGGRVRDVNVGIAAVMFASKLKRLSSAEVMQQKDEKKKKVIPLLHPTRTTRRLCLGLRAHTTALAWQGDGALSWRDKRKDAYLRTHHTPRPKEVVEAEEKVTLATVSFAAKLKLSARATSQASVPPPRPLA